MRTFLIETNNEGGERPKNISTTKRVNKGNQLSYFQSCPRGTVVEQPLSFTTMGVFRARCHL